MKRLKYLSLIAGALFVFSSCEKESEGLSNSNVLNFEIKGDETLLVPVGTTFTDPGFKILWNGEDVSEDVTVTQEVNSDVVGLYSVTYTFRNEQTGEEVRTRDVIVCDPAIEADMSGTYTTQNGTFRTGTGTDVPYPGFNVTVRKIAPGFFQISDFLGGYYDQRATYGKAYAGSGYVQLKSDNTFVLLSSYVPGWGDALSSLENGIYKPEDQSLSWTANYAGMIFNVVLK